MLLIESNFGNVASVVVLMVVELIDFIERLEIILFLSVSVYILRFFLIFNIII